MKFGELDSERRGRREATFQFEGGEAEEET